MGFSLSYRTTRPITGAEADAIIQDAALANEGRSWLSCEPVHFYLDREDGDRDDGELSGGSKPNFSTHPDDAASAAQSGLPDGTTMDLIDVLCDLSRAHGVDWEIGHDYATEPVGYIRSGHCDEVVRIQVEAFAELSKAIAEFDPDEFAFEDDGPEDE